MAKALGARQAVPVEGAVIAQAFPVEALLTVLERQGALKKAAVRRRCPTAARRVTGPGRQTSRVEEASTLMRPWVADTPQRGASGPSD